MGKNYTELSLHGMRAAVAQCLEREGEEITVQGNGE